MKTIQSDTKSYKSFIENLSLLNKGKVLVVGDLMLDTYLIGDSTRISPEAPVPVVKIEETKQVLGGAGNVARAITALGGMATIIGVVGEDLQASQMKDLFIKDGVKSHLVSSSLRQTTIKTRVLARGQQMLRMDTETSFALNSTEHKEVYKLLEEELGRHDVIIVSDYAKGFVTEELTNFLRKYKEKNRNIKIFADPKPENKFLYKDFFLLTPNLKESAELSHKKLDSLEAVEKAGKELRKELNLDFLLTTLGAEGMALFSKNEEVLHFPTSAQQVFDVTGAGDTVIASLALGVSVGLSEKEACMLANCAAGVVVGKVGSATVNQEEIIAVFCSE